jgi:hypothetical protein
VRLQGPQDKTAAKDWFVFLAHAGEQKKDIVDLMYAWLTEVHGLNTFVDERSLPYGVLSGNIMERSLEEAAVGATIASPSQEVQVPCLQHRIQSQHVIGRSKPAVHQLQRPLFTAPLQRSAIMHMNAITEALLSYLQALW